MTVTRTTLESGAYADIFAIVDNRANVDDPRNSGNTTKMREFVFDSDPFDKGLDFTGMPYIILELPTLETTNPTVDGKTHEIKWSQRITVRTL